MSLSPEQWKYERIYSSDTFYGTTLHGRGAWRLLPERPPSLLDVGCGDNRFIAPYRARGVRCMGVDFACPKADLCATVTQLPFADKEWAWITAFDVLEHLLPEEVPVALREFQRVATAYCVSICFRDSLFRAPDGSTLHPTVRTREWWIEQLRKYATVEARGNYLLGVFVM